MPEVKKVLADMGLRIAGSNNYKSWMAARKESGIREESLDSLDPVQEIRKCG